MGKGSAQRSHAVTHPAAQPEDPPKSSLLVDRARHVAGSATPPSRSWFCLLRQQREKQGGERQRQAGNCGKAAGIAAGTRAPSGAGGHRGRSWWGAPTTRRCAFVRSCRWGGCGPCGSGGVGSEPPAGGDEARARSGLEDGPSRYGKPFVASPTRDARRRKNNTSFRVFGQHWTPGVPLLAISFRFSHSVVIVSTPRPCRPSTPPPLLLLSSNTKRVQGCPERAGNHAAAGAGTQREARQGPARPSVQSLAG